MQIALNYFKNIPNKHINIFSFLLILISLLFLFSPWTLITNLFIAVFLTNIIFWLEGRFSFFFALVFLICTMLAVSLKEDVWAENFAILVYYLLLAGVFIEFLQMGIEKLNEKYTVKEFFIGYKNLIFKKVKNYFSKFKTEKNIENKISTGTKSTNNKSKENNSENNIFILKIGKYKFSIDKEN